MKKDRNATKIIHIHKEYSIVLYWMMILYGRLTSVRTLDPGDCLLLRIDA